MEELRQMREKQRAMDNKMHDLVKYVLLSTLYFCLSRIFTFAWFRENEQLWEQVTLLRAQHNRQQQVVTKVSAQRVNCYKRACHQSIMCVTVMLPRGCGTVKLRVKDEGRAGLITFNEWTSRKWDYWEGLPRRHDFFVSKLTIVSQCVKIFNKEKVPASR